MGGKKWRLCGADNLSVVFLRMHIRCHRQIGRYRTTRNKVKFVRYMKQLAAAIQKIVVSLRDYSGEDKSSFIDILVEELGMNVLAKALDIAVFIPKNFTDIEGAIRRFVPCLKQEDGQGRLVEHLKGSASLLKKLHKFYLTQKRLKIWET